MKKMFYCAALVCGLASCGSTQSQQEGEVASCCKGKQEMKTEMKSCCKGKLSDGAMTPEDVLEKGAMLLDKEVVMQGVVSHICRHSGMKCWVNNPGTETKIQVFAGEGMGKFTDEVSNKVIEVSGVVKEKRITLASILEKEQAQAQVQAEDGSSPAASADKGEGCKKMEGCHRVMAQREEMKQWMKDNNKDYYPVYFIEASAVKVAE